MLCPSDSFNSQPFNGSKSPETNRAGDGWARGNYGASAGLGYMTRNIHCNLGCSDVTACMANDNMVAWNDYRIRGVMGVNKAVDLERMFDGASKTILVGEVRAGVTEFDCRGTWL